MKDDIEAWDSRYVQELPLDDTIIPDEIRKIRHREVLKRRVMMAVAAFLALYILIKIVNQIFSEKKSN